VQTGVAQALGRFDRIEAVDQGEVSLVFTAPAGGGWRLDTSVGLSGWQPWLSFKSQGVNEHLDSGAAYQDRRFYRAVELASAAVLTGDHLPTANGDLVIHPVNHASLVLGWNGRTIYVDPVGGAALYQGLPRADLILITHQHGDHLHAATLEGVRGSDVAIIAPQTVFNSLSAGLRAVTTVLTNGASQDLLDLTVEAIPAYNLTTSNHPKGVGNGYVVTLGGKRIYLSGDTEDIPEMRALRDIDVAFVCMNVPFTMTVAKAASAVREFRPKVVYPYHYRNQGGSYADLDAFKLQVGTDLGIEVRKRAWY
jgi:L-ascorbate metabolism protein UlaG (beta-lactamase superfamily)